jgi:hypothetical protein
MGVDHTERARKPEKHLMVGPRIWLPLDMLQGAAYASLSFSAKSLLLDLAAQLRSAYGQINNNGDLTTALKTMSKRGWKDGKTIRKAAELLESAGLIVKTRQGRLPNKANLYALTWLPLNESPKLDITAKGYPLYAYRRIEKVTKPIGHKVALKVETLLVSKSAINGEKILKRGGDCGKYSISEVDESKLDKEKIPLSVALLEA